MLIAWPESRRHSVVGEHLHVAGEDDEVDVELVDQPQQLGLGLRLGLRGDRDVAEVQAVGADQRLGVGVVGDHDRDLDLQRAGARAEEQVVEAVQVLGDHDQRAVRRGRVPELELHRELLGDPAKSPRSVSASTAVGDDEVDPHEEAPDELVAELLALEDVAAVARPGTR